MSSLALRRLIVSDEVGQSGPQSRVIHVARGHLVRWWIWPRCGWVRFMELDVSSRQEASGNDDGGSATVLFKFQAKPVRAVGTRAWLPPIVSPSPNIT